MSLANFISENFILPVHDIVTRQSVNKHLRFLMNSQFWTREQINSFQIAKLRKLILHTFSFVPYYKELFSDLRLKPGDFHELDDLHKIPILNKETLFKKGLDKFTSTGISKKDRIQSSSSGSTGEPLFYYRTRDAYSMNLAASLRGWYWMGYRLGDRYIKLSQNPRKAPLKKLQDKMSRNLYLATNPLVVSNLDFIMKEIERYKPKVIRCYPDPLLFLARYKQDHHEFSFRPFALTTTGNILYSETREEIEATFGCKIFDSYNCEGNSTVFECPTHTCYHSAEEYGITEVLDENGSPIKNGIGRLISTDLWNFAYPFIRYDTQDLVEVSNESCSCGRNHLRINRIIGRDNDVLVAPNGRKFIVHNFTGFFHSDLKELRRSIDQFQVVNLRNGSLLFRIIINANYDQSVREFIISYWEKEFQSPVDVEISESIPISNSGKRKFVIIEK